MPKGPSSPTIALTERDHELLASLAEYRYLSTAQVQRLHFPSLQTAARRLRLLAGGGYLRTFRPSAGGEQLVALAKSGAETLAEMRGDAAPDVKWSKRREQPKDYLFLRHFLAISDFRITLTKACAASREIRLLGFLPEQLTDGAANGPARPHIRESTSDGATASAPVGHTPDGVFALERCGVPALFFLEVDRGTEVLSNPERGFLKLVRFYLALLTSGSYQRFQSDFGVPSPFRAFRVLIVTSSELRIANIRRLCGGSAEGASHAKRFLWLTAEEATHDLDLLVRGWSSLDPEDDRVYRIVPDRP